MLRLAEVGIERLAELVTDAWRMRAPETLARTAVIDAVAWVRLENGRILCARPRGKDIFYIPGGKREGAESDLQTLLREIAEELTIKLLPETVTHVGTYEADQPDGRGPRAATPATTPGRWPPAARSTSSPGSPTRTVPGSPADQLLFDDLKATGDLR